LIGTFQIRYKMKILALIDSPRKGSNTDILVDGVLQGAQSWGHATEKIYHYDYLILPCFDCSRCKKDNFTWPPVGRDVGDLSQVGGG
jgi:multimeric flavodoxin WrbA